MGEREAAGCAVLAWGMAATLLGWPLVALGTAAAVVAVDRARVEVEATVTGRARDAPVVELRTDHGDLWCAVPWSTWSGLAVGDRAVVPVGRVFGAPACEAVRRP